MEAKTTGIELIAEERLSAINYKNRTIIADVQFNSNPDTDFYDMYPLVMGAIDLIDPRGCKIPKHWNVEALRKRSTKPYMERLIIAGQLIAAEIDRLIYIEENPK